MDKADLNLYNKLYSEHWDSLFKMAKYVLHSESLAEDLTQKVFMVCFCKFKEVKDHPCPERWLKKAMKNMIGNELKRNQVRDTHSANLFVDQYAAVESTERLEDVLPSELSENDRQLLIWAYDDLLSHSEIASRLGISENACRTRVFRARARCGEILKRNFEKIK